MAVNTGLAQLRSTMSTTVDLGWSTTCSPGERQTNISRLDRWSIHRWLVHDLSFSSWLITSHQLFENLFQMVNVRDLSVYITSCWRAPQIYTKLRAIFFLGHPVQQLPHYVHYCRSLGTCIGSSDRERPSICTDHSDLPYRERLLYTRQSDVQQILRAIHAKSSPERTCWMYTVDIHGSALRSTARVHSFTAGRRTRYRRHVADVALARGRHTARVFASDSFFLLSAFRTTWDRVVYHHCKA